jgi:O-antigen/teichoic acid export membrane protein
MSERPIGPNAMLARIKQNVSRKLAGEVGSRMVSLALNVALTQGLGKAAYGRYTFAYAFAGIAAMCGELGLNTLLTREIARDRTSAAATVRAFAPLRMLSVSAVAVVTLAAAALSADAYRLPEIALLSVFMAGNTLLDYHCAILSAHERMGEEALVRIGVRTAVGLLGIGAILSGASLFPVLVALCGGNFVAALGAGVARRRLGVPSLASAREEANVPGRASAGRMLADGLPFAAAWWTIVVYFYMDSVLLERLGLSDSDLGQYGAAHKILEAAQAIPLVLVGGLFPIVAERAHGGNARAAAPYFAQTARASIVLGAPLAAVGAILAAPVSRLLYGDAYSETGRALALLALGTPFFFANLIAIYFFLAVGLRWEAALLRGGACLLKVFVILGAVRTMGVAGASLSLLVADAGLFAVIVVFRRARGLAEPGELGVFARVAAVSAMGLLAYTACEARPWTTQGLAVGAVFLGGYYFLGRLDRTFFGVAGSTRGAPG